MLPQGAQVFFIHGIFTKRSRGSEGSLTYDRTRSLQRADVSHAPPPPPSPPRSNCCFFYTVPSPRPRAGFKSCPSLAPAVVLSCRHHMSGANTPSDMMRSQWKKLSNIDFNTHQSDQHGPHSEDKNLGTRWMGHFVESSGVVRWLIPPRPSAGSYAGSSLPARQRGRTPVSEVVRWLIPPHPSARLYAGSSLPARQRRGGAGGGRPSYVLPPTPCQRCVNNSPASDLDRFIWLVSYLLE